MDDVAEVVRLTSRATANMNIFENNYRDLSFKKVARAWGQLAKYDDDIRRIESPLPDSLVIEISTVSARIRENRVKFLMQAAAM